MRSATAQLPSRTSVLVLGRDLGGGFYITSPCDVRPGTCMDGRKARLVAVAQKKNADGYRRRFSLRDVNVTRSGRPCERCFRGPLRSPPRPNPRVSRPFPSRSRDRGRFPNCAGPDRFRSGRPARRSDRGGPRGFRDPDRAPRRMRAGCCRGPRRESTCFPASTDCVVDEVRDRAAKRAASEKMTDRLNATATGRRGGGDPARAGRQIHPSEVVAVGRFDAPCRQQVVLRVTELTFRNGGARVVEIAAVEPHLRFRHTIPDAS